MTWTREDLAWAAGLFEGEGCFSRTHGVPVANLGMTDNDIVLRFRDVVGFGSIYEINNSRKNPRWSDGLQWSSTNFAHTQQTVAMFWPWLGTRRRARAHELLAGYHRQRAERGIHSLSYEWFGMRHKDLSPAQKLEYDRRKHSRLYSLRKEGGTHPT